MPEAGFEPTPQHHGSISLSALITAATQLCSSFHFPSRFKARSLPQQASFRLSSQLYKLFFVHVASLNNETLYVQIKMLRLASAVFFANIDLIKRMIVYSESLVPQMTTNDSGRVSETGSTRSNFKMLSIRFHPRWGAAFIFLCYTRQLAWFITQFITWNKFLIVSRLKLESNLSSGK